jgi:signal peptidase II
VDREQVQPSAGTKVVLFVGILAGVLVLDISTKLLVQANMHLYQQIDIIGEYVRLTYIYNPGAAFGIQVGEYSRQIFLVLSVVALVALSACTGTRRCRTACGSWPLRSSAAAPSATSSTGSDRRSGVVDFIDVGVGTIRWPVFNIADMAVTTGAIVLALSLWREEQRTDS